MAKTTPYQSRRHLPADLFPEILSRLPVKSLLRFRCVSKPWLALVDDDAHFARLHLNAFKNNTDQTRLFVEQIRIGRQTGECVVRRSDTFEPIPEVPLTFPTGSQYVVSSLHGLILLAYETRKVDQFWDLKVWNPSIRKLKEVPPLLKPEILSDSILPYGRVGLGYDPETNNYKIVRLICYRNTLHSVAIHALGTDSWKIIKVEDKGSPLSNWHRDVYAFGEAVYFRSSLYFLADDAQKYGVEYLFWFNLSKEVFSSVRMPDGFRGSSWPLMLADAGSSLVAFDSNSLNLYTWVADRESMCLTKHSLYAMRNSHLLHINKNGDILTRQIWIDSLEEDDVTAISRETGDSKTLQRRFGHFISHVSCYVESLILHK